MATVEGSSMASYDGKLRPFNIDKSLKHQGSTFVAIYCTSLLRQMLNLDAPCFFCKEIVQAFSL
jgi:hypothetical protein